MLNSVRQRTHRSAMTEIALSLALATGVCVTGPVANMPSAYAADAAELEVSINHHKFEPSELKVPVGTPIKLLVKNFDATAEEFESAALKVEKVIAGNGTAIIRLRPLAKGSYAFFGEYHEDTAKGVLVAE